MYLSVRASLLAQVCQSACV